MNCASHTALAWYARSTHIIVPPTPAQLKVPIPCPVKTGRTSTCPPAPNPWPPGASTPLGSRLDIIVAAVSGGMILREPTRIPGETGRGSGRSAVVQGRVGLGRVRRGLTPLKHKNKLLSQGF